jgi:hypothetical protein
VVDFCINKSTVQTTKISSLITAENLTEMSFGHSGQITKNLSNFYFGSILLFDQSGTIKFLSTTIGAF